MITANSLLLLQGSQLFLFDSCNPVSNVSWQVATVMAVELLLAT